MSIIKGQRASEELTRLFTEFGEDDREQLQADIRTVLKTPAGRRLLMAIAWKEHVFGTIGEGGENTTQVMIEVGRHNLAQDILRDANIADCEAVALAMRERNEILKARNERIKRVKEKLETMNGK